MKSHLCHFLSAESVYIIFVLISQDCITAYCRSWSFGHYVSKGVLYSLYSHLLSTVFEPTVGRSPDISVVFCFTSVIAMYSVFCNFVNKCSKSA